VATSLALPRLYALLLGGLRLVLSQGLGTTIVGLAVGS
jgi:hypothetical protein